MEGKRPEEEGDGSFTGFTRPKRLMTDCGEWWWWGEQRDLREAAKKGSGECQRADTAAGWMEGKRKEMTRRLEQSPLRKARVTWRTWRLICFRKHLNASLSSGDPDREGPPKHESDVPEDRVVKISHPGDCRAGSVEKALASTVDDLSPVP